MTTLPPPLLLSIRFQEDRLLLLLTDFRAVSLHASCTFNLARVSDAACWSYDGLLPGAVGAFLRTTSSRFLSLQLPSNLLGIEWENLLDGTSRLGEKFAITRQLALDNEDLVSDAHSEVQRVLQTRPTDISPEDDLAPVNHPLALYDALILPSVEAFYVTAARLKRRLMGAETVPELPSVFLLPVDQTLNSGNEFAALPTVARLTAALGLSVIMYSGDEGEGVSHQSFFDALLVGLDTGCPVSEAVRQVRCAFPNSSLRLALYGDGMQILAKRQEGKVRLEEGVQEAIEARDEFALQDSLRQVTVLSFDLVNSTQLLIRLGGEQYSEMLANFHERCLTIIRECGGVSDDPQGDDGVMSYFGYPVAHENAASHAVGAGLRITQVMAELSPTWQVQVRVGIATGQVAVKGGQPVGFAVHLAARLQVLACPNSVIISNQTRVLLGSSFVLKAFSEGPEIKGVTEPQVLFEVLGLAPRTLANSPDSGAVRTTFVGRATEFDWLLGQWSSVQNKVGKVVLLSGEAGIGKSRLIREFRQHLDLSGRTAVDLSRTSAANKTIDVQSHFYLELRCHQDSSTSAFSSVIDALRFIFRVSPKEDAQSQIQKILNRWRTEPALPDPQALQIIAALLGIPLPAEMATIFIAPDSLRQRTLDLMVHTLRQASLRTPICMVVEDFQWVDPSTKELVDRLAQGVETWPILLQAGDLPVKFKISHFEVSAKGRRHCLFAN
jgi:class 3 adenylate cyclase